jgi:outer membrane protein TolC
MNVLRNIGWFVLLVLAGCVPERARGLIEDVSREPAIAANGPAERDSETWTSDEPVPLELDALQRLAVARDPELAAMAHRARAMLHAARAETELPPPELGVQLWNLRLTPPYDMSTLDMVMFELRQAFPPGGSRDAMGRAMAEEARAMAAEAATREQELRLMVAERHAELTAAFRLRTVFTDQDRVLDQAIELARAMHAVEGTALEEVVRLEAERASVLRRLERADRDAAVARAALNALLQRPPDAPLGEPPGGEARTVHLPLADLLDRMERSRAVLGASRARVDAARARAEAARTEAERPDVMLGVTAWYSPMGNDAGVGGMVSVSLPWATAMARERAAAAAELEAGEDEMARGTLAGSRGEVGLALARLGGLERELAVIRSRVRPAAERSVEAMSAAYLAGRSDLLPWIDAIRMVLEVRMEEIDVMMELAMAVAELEWAVGEPLPQATVGEEETHEPAE